MLSKNMYLVLSCFPRNYGNITYKELLKKCKLSEDDILSCLTEMLFLDNRYIRTDEKPWYDSTLSLTETGLVRVEAYEYEQKNMSFAKISLYTAIFAMVASIASAVAAVLALLIQYPPFLNWISG